MSNTNTNNDNTKNSSSSITAPYIPDRSLTVDFDPTDLGLPSHWRLTDYSELKG